MLALSSATFHSQLKTELLKLSYPGSTLAPPHIRYHCNRSPTMSPRLDLPGFWPGIKTKQEVLLDLE